MLKSRTMIGLFSCAVGLFIVTLMSVLSAGAVENKPDTPKFLNGVKVVSVEEVKALLNNKSIKIFDMRSAINYGKGHLPGAVALPYKENSEFKADFDASKDSLDMSKLPSDKNVQLLFYSDGPSGWKSYKAAVLAHKAGYRKIMWFREGTAGWIARGNAL